MKVKRLVSVLLAALLLVGMIPMNALAANTATQEKDLLNIQVMVSTEAPEIDEDIYGLFDNDYTDLYTGDSGSQEEARQLVEDTVEAANGIWEWDPSGKLDDVEPGTTIYLGFKVSLDKTKTNQFTSLAGFTLKMQYDPDVLVPVHGGENSRGNANSVYNKGDPMLAGTLGKNYTDKEFQDSIILNQMYDTYYVDFFTSAASEIQDADAGWRDNLWADVLKYGGQLKINSSECIVAGGNTAYTGELALAFASNTGNMPATSEATTWDFVVPMMVKGTEAAGSLNGKTSTKVTYRISSSDSGSSTVTVSRVDRTKTKNDLATDSADYSFAYADYISANDVTINVLSTEPGLKTVENKTTVSAVSGDDTTEIKVQMNQYAKANSDTTDKTKWTVTSTGGGTPSVESVAVDGQVITLTVKNLPAGDVTVTAGAGAVSGTDGTATSTALSVSGITAVNAPVAKIDYANGQVVEDTTGGTYAGEGIQVQIGGTGAWHDLPYTLTAADIETLSTTKSITVADKDDHTISSTLTDITIGATPTLTIDYEGETTNETGAGLEKKSGTGYTSAGTGKIALTPGTDLVVRTAGTNSALPSKDYTLVVKAAPVLTSDSTANETVEKQGKTNVTLTATPAAPINYTTDTDSTQKDVTGGTVWTTGPVDLTVGQYLHAQVLASNANQTFKSNAVVVTGRGWNYVKINETSIDLEDAATQDISLTLDGPTDKISWATGINATDIFKITTTTPDAAALTVTSFSNGTLSISGTPTKGATYTLTVEPGAISGNALNVGDGTGSAHTVTLNAPMDDAQPFVVTGYDYEGKVSKNGTVNVDLSDKLTGKEIKTVKSSDETLVTAEVSTDDHKVLVVKGTEKISGEPEGKKPVELTITTGDISPSLKSEELPTEAIDQEETVEVTITNWGDLDATAVKVDVEPDGIVEAKVENGKLIITGKKGGTAKITVKNGDEPAAPFEVTVLAKATKVKVETPSAKEGTIKDVAEQLADTDITVTVDGKSVTGKLGELVSAEEIAAEIIEQVAQAAGDAAAQAKLEEAIKEYGDDPYERDEDGEIVVDEDGNPSFTDEFVEWATETPVSDDEDALTWAKAIDAAGEEAAAAVTEDTTLSAGQNIDLSGLKEKLTKAAVTEWIDDDDEKFANTKTAEDVTIDTDALGEITVSKKGGGGGSYVPNVELETHGFGTADGPVELDGDNKVTKLPGVIGQKLGTIFKGWATQDGNPNTIVKEGREIAADTTLYGIFEGYMNGDTNASGKRTARPNDPVTRAELATMLVRAAGIYDASKDYTTTFTDAQGAWYTPYIGAAQQAGIMSGYNDGTVHPTSNITREEVAAMIVNTFKVAVTENGTTDYVVDFDKTANWAKDYVAALVNNGTSIGNENKEYLPKNDITRAEVAAMINKYIGLTSVKKTALAGDTTVASPFVDVTNREGWYYSEMLFAALCAPVDYYVTEITYPTR